MPRPQNNTVLDFEKTLGRTAEPETDTISDFEAHRVANSAPARPMTPAQINATLAPGSSPVGQRTMTPAEREMTATTPPSPLGAHGEMAPAGAHPLAATINPVTKKPFPGQQPEMTHEQKMAALRKATPWVTGAALSAVAGPEVGVPAGIAIGTLGAAAGAAGAQFFDPERPDSAAARGLDILEPALEYGVTEAGMRGLHAAGKGLLSRYFPEIHEAIQQGVTKFLHAVPSNDIAVRENYNVAMGDLQKIAREMLQTRSTLGIANPGTGVFSREAPGGIVSAELRPTELYTHIKDYLGRMYSDERKWQIMQAGGQQLTVSPARAAKFDADVFADAMRRIARIPDVEEGTHKIAARVAANPMAPITPEEADLLEQASSAMLRKFRAGTGSKQAVDMATQRNTALMEHADEMLNDSLNHALQQGGLPGINGYARRYAALARVMDGLERMIPTTERGRLGLGPAEVVSPSKIVRTVTTMAGQNPGREIEDALRVLSRAPEIPTPTGVPITPLPGRQGPIVGPPGATVIPHPPGGAPPPAGPPLNMGTPPALGPGTPPALPPAGYMPNPPTPPFVPAGQELANKKIAQLIEIRNRMAVLNASAEDIAAMDRRIAELNRRVSEVGDVSKAPGGAERRAAGTRAATGHASPESIKYETIKGTRWASVPSIPEAKVSVPPDLPEDQVEAYVRQKLKLQADFLAKRKLDAF